jgi:hypothetical protein
MHDASIDQAKTSLQKSAVPRSRGTMLETIVRSVAGLITATISAIGYLGFLLPDGDRVGVHTAAFRDHHALRRIPGVDQALQPHPCRDLRRDRVQCQVGHAIGMYGGRPLVERWGAYVLMSRRDLDLAERFFARYGGITVFVGRLLPVIRTFIALPAGIAC